MALLALGSQARATETTAQSQTAPPPVQVLISVPEQRLAVIFDGKLLDRFPVSTSRYGTGDQFWSYRTPLGNLEVYDKIGGGLAPGAVIRHRTATGEVLPVDAPGRDPIVTRLIWLEGLEPQNKNALSRCIYIHGTPDEKTIGTPNSYGCIRMRSKDVINFYDEIPVGTIVSIIPGRLPHLPRYKWPKETPAPEITQPASPPDAEIAATKPAATSQPAATDQKPAAPPAPAATKLSEIAPPNPPPVIAEAPDQPAPDRGSSDAWKAMKGSFLLANIPLLGVGKVDDHHKKPVTGSN
jgi:hypothetical protein